MRQPLNNVQISGYTFRERTDQNSGLPDSSGVRRHLGVDLVANVGTPFYAPESGRIINVWGGRQNVAGGNIVELQGTYTHRFLHLYQIGVSAGQQVSEGQQLGTTGNSGNVGSHLHFDTRHNNTAWNSSLYNYVDWTAMLKSNQGEPPMTAEEERNAYRIVLGREMEHGGSGRTGYKFIVDAKGETDAQKAYRANLEKNLGDTQASVAGMQAQINELSLNPTKLEYATVQAELSDKLTLLSATQTALDVERLKIKEKIIYTHDESLVKEVKGLKGLLLNFFKVLKGLKK